MASLKKEMNQKIKTMQALAPVAFMSNLVSPFWRAIAPYVYNIDWTTQMLGSYEFSPSDDVFNLGTKALCTKQSMFIEMCANQLFLMGGFNSEQMNRTMLPEIMKNIPAGSSVKQVTKLPKKYNHFIFGLIFLKPYYG
jgi:lysosomal acid lipase/cholesteryl ester hydrolase